MLLYITVNPGGRAFSSDFTSNSGQQCRAFSRTLKIEKLTCTSRAVNSESPDHQASQDPADLPTLFSKQGTSGYSFLFLCYFLASFLSC